ncbi:MAG: hypothetical protein K9L66_04290 [Spirochaetaceae bacterium]|nr:hypothetical protein [Spirochaetaceae bacterium]MCF7947980.1 hypothetical protein [Spirochaetia bacterium]MCF7950871.1 hypothetical protein [Spirochaetaceae bacterium]
MRQISVQSHPKRGKRPKIEGNSIFYALIFTLLFSLPGISLYGQQYGSLPNQELSAHYTRLARQSSEAGNPELSAKFTDTALVFWKNNPDALYLEAKTHIQNENYERAIELMTAALSGEVFGLFGKENVFLEYLDLLTRFDHAQRALVLLQNLPYEQQQQREYLKIAVRALHTEGRTEQLKKQVSRGINLYPGESLFQQQYAQQNSEYRRQLRQNILRNNESNYYTKPAYQALIAATHRPADLAELLVLYSERWGSDFFSRVQGYRLGQELSLEELERLFSSLTTVTDTQLSMLLDIARVFSSESDVTRAFLKFSGEVTRDPDKDGEVEIRETYIRGIIQRVDETSHGELRFERVLELQEGRPSWLSVQTGDTSSLRLYYSNYPQLLRAESSVGSSMIEIDLVPYSVEYKLPGWEDYNAPYRVPLPTVETVPALSTLLAKSADIRAEENRKDPYTYSFSRDKGLLEAVARENTRVESDFLSGTITKRRRDMDGDGFFEIIEYYRDAKLIRITYDGNKNSIPEYIEEYAGSTPIRKWDTDEDGKVEYQMQLENK